MTGHVGEVDSAPLASPAEPPPGVVCPGGALHIPPGVGPLPGQVRRVEFLRDDTFHPGVLAGGRKVAGVGPGVAGRDYEASEDELLERPAASFVRLVDDRLVVDEEVKGDDEHPRAALPRDASPGQPAEVGEATGAGDELPVEEESAVMLAEDVELRHGGGDGPAGAGPDPDLASVDSDTRPPPVRRGSAAHPLSGPSGRPLVASIGARSGITAPGWPLLRFRSEAAEQAAGAAQHMPDVHSPWSLVHV